MNISLGELGDAIAKEVVRSLGGAGSEWYSLWQKAATSVLVLQDDLERCREKGKEAIDRMSLAHAEKVSALEETIRKLEYQPSVLSTAGHEALLAEIAELREERKWLACPAEFKAITFKYREVAEDYRILANETALLRTIRDENDAEIMCLAETCMNLELEISRLKRIHTDQAKVIRSLRQDMARVRRAMGVRPPRRRR